MVSIFSETEMDPLAYSIKLKLLYFSTWLLRLYIPLFPIQNFLFFQNTFPPEVVLLILSIKILLFLPVSSHPSFLSFIHVSPLQQCTAATQMRSSSFKHWQSGPSSLTFNYSLSHISYLILLLTCLPDWKLFGDGKSVLCLLCIPQHAWHRSGHKY